VCVCVCVFVCDLETTKLMLPSPELGCCATENCMSVVAEIQSKSFHIQRTLIVQVKASCAYALELNHGDVLKCGGI
jgi:hypothetical protein